jgi:hypothetical protein
MAIKGKGKTRSRRAVSPAPRPQIVTRKKPILMRVTTWIVLGCVLLAAIGFGAWTWYEHHQASELLAREQAALQDVTQRVRDQLPADQTTPQGTSQIALFPTLPQTLDQIDKGQISEKKAGEQAQAVIDQAAKAEKGIQGIAWRSIIKDEFDVGVTPALRAPGMTSSVLNETQDQLIKSFQLYQSAGHLMQLAIDQPKGPERTALITQAKTVSAVATELFSRGYNTLVQIESILGLIQPAALQPSPPAGG